MAETRPGSMQVPRSRFDTAFSWGCLQKEETPLHEACAQGHAETVAALLTVGADPTIANEVRYRLWTFTSGLSDVGRLRTRRHCTMPAELGTWKACSTYCHTAALTSIVKMRLGS